MKKCPYCAEEIQDEALKCRFCGEYLKKKSKWKSCFLGCLITSVGGILLFILSLYLSFWLLKFIVYKMFFAQPNTPHYYYYPPFTGPGLENMFRDFSEFFRSFWERLMEFFSRGGQKVI